MKYLAPLFALLLLAACGGGRTSGRAPVVNGTLSFPTIQGFELHQENVDGLITWYDETNFTRVSCRKLGESERGLAARQVKAMTKDGIPTGRKALSSLGNCAGSGEYVDAICGGRYKRVVGFEARVGGDRYLIIACCDRAEKRKTIQMYDSVISKLTMTP